MFRIPGRSALGPSALPAGSPPSAPSAVTSITKDSGATVSFLPPTSPGTGAITSYTVTPYIAGAAQSPTTIAAGSAGSISGSNGSTYAQVPVAGLTNGTAYTFSVHASSLYGAGAESGQSGANTPLSGLVFGDDFGGPASGAIDPEWFVYSRCGYIAQSEIEWYLPSQVSLDGSSHLLLTATKTAHSGPSYPSDGNTVRNQSWLSGACQSNTKTWAPASGNTMTFEAKQQICPGVSGGMWPGLFWLAGSDFLTAWKTDPNQPSWNTTGKAEIDIAEWNPPSSGGTTNYGNNCYTSGTSPSPSGFSNLVSTATDFSAAMHVFTCRWKPGVSVTWLTDGTQTNTETSAVPASGAAFMLLLYLQILAGSATATQSCTIDYVRVWDQNLG